MAAAALATRSPTILLPREESVSIASTTKDQGPAETPNDKPATGNDPTTSSVMPPVPSIDAIAPASSTTPLREQTSFAPLISSNSEQTTSTGSMSTPASTPAVEFPFPSPVSLTISAILDTSGTLEIPGYGIVPSPTSTPGDKGPLSNATSSVTPVFTPSLLGNAYGGGFIRTPSIYVTKLPYPSGPSKDVPPGYGFSSKPEVLSGKSATLQPTASVDKDNESGDKGGLAVSMTQDLGDANLSRTPRYPFPNSTLVPSTGAFPGLVVQSNVSTALSVMETAVRTTMITAISNQGDSKDSMNSVANPRNSKDSIQVSVSSVKETGNADQISNALFTGMKISSDNPCAVRLTTSAAPKDTLSAFFPTPEMTSTAKDSLETITRKSQGEASKDSLNESDEEPTGITKIASSGQIIVQTSTPLPISVTSTATNGQVTVGLSTPPAVVKSSTASGGEIIVETSSPAFILRHTATSGEILVSTYNPLPFVVTSMVPSGQDKAHDISSTSGLSNSAITDSKDSEEKSIPSPIFIVSTAMNGVVTTLTTSASPSTASTVGSGPITETKIIGTLIPTAAATSPSVAGLAGSAPKTETKIIGTLIPTQAQSISSTTEPGPKTETEIIGTLIPTKALMSTTAATDGPKSEAITPAALLYTQTASGGEIVVEASTAATNTPIDLAKSTSASLLIGSPIIMGIFRSPISLPEQASTGQFIISAGLTLSQTASTPSSAPSVTDTASAVGGKPLDAASSKATDDRVATEDAPLPTISAKDQSLSSDQTPGSTTQSSTLGKLSSSTIDQSSFATDNPAAALNTDSQSSLMDTSIPANTDASSSITSLDGRKYPANASNPLLTESGKPMDDDKATVLPTILTPVVGPNGLTSLAVVMSSSPTSQASLSTQGADTVLKPVTGANAMTSLAVIPSPVVGENGLTSLAVFSTPVAAAIGITSPAVMLTPVVGADGLTSLAVLATPVVGANGKTSLAIGLQGEQNPSGTPSLIQATIPISSANGGSAGADSPPVKFPPGISGISGSASAATPTSPGGDNASVHVQLNPTAAEQFEGSALQHSVGHGATLVWIAIIMLLL